MPILAHGSQPVPAQHKLEMLVSLLLSTAFNLAWYPLPPCEPKHCCSAVDDAVLAEDTFSNTVLQDYSSVTACFNVSIDSSAWFPDLAAAVNATHNQFVDVMEPLGFSVVCHHSAYPLSAYLFCILSCGATDILSHTSLCN